MGLAHNVWRRDPRVALSIVDFQNPYMEAQLRGRVVERRPDLELAIMDPVSRKYTGKPFPFRDPEGRVALVIELDRARMRAPLGCLLSHLRPTQQESEMIASLWSS